MWLRMRRGYFTLRYNFYPVRPLPHQSIFINSMRADIFNIPLAAKRHGDIHFLLDDLQGARDARLTACSQPLSEGAADTGRLCTKSQGLDHILARPDAAIEIDFSLSTNSGYNFRQDADRGWRTIQLAPTMIRNDDAIRAIGYG